MKIKVLFLCTGNSCRSQMAEGWTNHLFGDVATAFSAGTRPSSVHPLAVSVMAEAGVDISKQWSKHLSLFLHREFDLVITLCDGAKEECPHFPWATRFIHRGFQDPAAMDGTRAEKVEKFREVRDEIRSFVQDLFEGSRK